MYVTVSKTHYAYPKNEDIENVLKLAFPKKIRLNTQWAENTWYDCRGLLNETFITEPLHGWESLCWK